MASKDKSVTEGNSGIDKDLIRELAGLLDETGLTEIEIEREGLRVRVGRAGTVMHATASHAVPPPPIAAPAAVGSPDPAKHPGAVNSPMVGTAYRGAAPGATPFVDIGSKVGVGDTLLIIERRDQDGVDATHLTVCHVPIVRLTRAHDPAIWCCPRCSPK